MKKLLIGTLIIGALTYLLFSYFFVDIQINKYASIDAVKDQKAMQEGWVPSILPASAYDIIETHNLDENEIFGSFKYKDVDEEAFLKHITKNSDDVLEWDHFLFQIDEEVNLVKYRNKPNINPTPPN